MQNQAQDVVHVLEGVVIGHAKCRKEGCTATPKRVVDPYEKELYGEIIEIDICDEHLEELHEAI
jgi:hypothetical protein